MKTSTLRIFDLLVIPSAILLPLDGYAFYRWQDYPEYFGATALLFVLFLGIVGTWIYLRALWLRDQIPQAARRRVFNAVVLLSLILLALDLWILFRSPASDVRLTVCAFLAGGFAVLPVVWVLFSIPWDKTWNDVPIKTWIAIPSWIIGAILLLGLGTFELLGAHANGTSWPSFSQFLTGLVCLFNAFASVKAMRRQREQLRSTQGQCAKCGYDLRASKDRCPECGATIPAGEAA